MQVKESSDQNNTHHSERTLPMSSGVSESPSPNHQVNGRDNSQSSKRSTMQGASALSSTQESNGRIETASKKHNPVPSTEQPGPSSTKNEYSSLYKAPVVEPLPLSRGPISSDFVILKVIGQGAFGKVLQVAHRGSGQVYGMKVYSKKFLAEHDQLEYTISEKLIMTRMRHPYVIRLRYAFQTPDKLFLLSDYCAGGELFNILRKQGCFLEYQARVYLAQLVLALEYMHAHGVIHRDLKPENILLDASGHINITDFGLAKDFTVAVNSDRTPAQRHGFLTSNQEYDYVTLMRQAVARKPEARGGRRNRKTKETVEYLHPHEPHRVIHTKSLVGTDEYLAPEMILSSQWYHNRLVEEREKNERKRQAAAGANTPGTETPPGTPTVPPSPTTKKSAPDGPTGPGYDRSVDLWALGALAFEMLTGDAPFRDRSKMQLYRKILNGRLVYPRHLSRNAVSFIKGLLERDPTKRMGYAEGSDAVSVFRGMDAIKRHPFFESIDWDKLMRREVVAPLPVEVTSVTDYRHFDSYFTDMELTLDLNVEGHGGGKQKAGEAGKKKGQKNDTTPTTTPATTTTTTPVKPTKPLVPTTTTATATIASPGTPMHRTVLPSLRIPRVSDTIGSSPVVSGTPIQVRSRETIGDTHTDHADPPPKIQSDSPLPLVTPTTHPELYQQLANQQMDTSGDPVNALADNATRSSSDTHGSRNISPVSDPAPPPPPVLSHARFLSQLQLQSGALGYGSPLLRPMAGPTGRKQPPSALSRHATAPGSSERPQVYNDTGTAPGTTQSATIPMTTDSLMDLDDLPDLALPEAASLPDLGSATMSLCMYDHSIENFPATPKGPNTKVEYPAEYHISGFSWVASSVVEELADLLLNKDEKLPSARDMSARSTVSMVSSLNVHQEQPLDATSETLATSSLEGSMINLQLGDATGDNVIGSTGILTNAVQTEHGFFVGTIQELPPLKLQGVSLETTTTETENAAPVALPALAKDNAANTSSQGPGQSTDTASTNEETKTSTSPTSMFKSLFPGMEVPPVVHSDGSFTVTGSAAPDTNVSTHRSKKKNPPTSHITTTTTGGTRSRKISTNRSNLKIAVPKDNDKNPRQRQGRKKNEPVVYPVGMSPPASGTPTRSNTRNRNRQPRKDIANDTRGTASTASNSTERGKQSRRQNSTRTATARSQTRRTDATEKQQSLPLGLASSSSSSSKSSGRGAGRASHSTSSNKRGTTPTTVAGATPDTTAVSAVPSRPNTWASRVKGKRRSTRKRSSNVAVTTVESGVSLASVLASSKVSDKGSSDRRPVTMADKLRSGAKF